MRHAARYGRAAPGAASAAVAADEAVTIGSGLPQAVLWSELAADYGEGSVLVDVDGNCYLDFMGAGGVNSVGHGHPTVAEAVAAQARRVTVGAFPSAARAELMRELRAVLPPELDAVQLYSGGTEAVEAALRLAKSFTGRYEFLSFWGGFHGKTLAAAALTTNARPALGPLPGGYHSAPYARATGTPAADAAETARCAALARETVRQQVAGGLAAVVVEPLQGRAGNIVPAAGFLAECAAIARDNGALLVSDESMTGFGRTGRDFGYQHEHGVVPDVLVLGKGLGAGYPVTAVAARRELMSRGPFAQPSASSSSFGGFPVACAAGAAALRVIREEGLVERAREGGERLLGRLRADLAGVAGVRDVRGRGLAVAVEPADPARVEPLFRSLVDRGLLVMLGGGALRLYPPLTVRDDELDDAVAILAEVLAEGCAP